MFVHNTAQYSYDYFPPNIQIIITAQMLSNGEEGASYVSITSRILSLSLAPF